MAAHPLTPAAPPPDPSAPDLLLPRPQHFLNLGERDQGEVAFDGACERAHGAAHVQPALHPVHQVAV